MSISSTGLYGSASIVNTDIFDDLLTLKEEVTALSTIYLTTTNEHRIDILQNKQDISSNLNTIIDLSNNRIKDIEDDITDLSNNRIKDSFPLRNSQTQSKVCAGGLPRKFQDNVGGLLTTCLRPQQADAGRPKKPNY